MLNFVNFNGNFAANSEFCVKQKIFFNFCLIFLIFVPHNVLLTCQD